MLSTLCETNELYEDSTEFALIDEKRLLTCKINDSLKSLKRSCKCIDKLGFKLQVKEQNCQLLSLLLLCDLLLQHDSLLLSNFLTHVANPQLSAVVPSPPDPALPWASPSCLAPTPSGLAWWTLFQPCFIVTVSSCRALVIKLVQRSLASSLARATARQQCLLRKQSVIIISLVDTWQANSLISRTQCRCNEERVESPDYRHMCLHI
ncbi:Hypothetical_protein [Hexamita inflata]|uniref:Hypothetical_protein n=1 Tax=Hexamita inflata TaxID=28002 RepID=A0AA86TG43_9EUKA|nr:Hypothetical protein HINF_LOCUS4275 [Hexamita inflata]